jgi:hypothetical protein
VNSDEEEDDDRVNKVVIALKVALLNEKVLGDFTAALPI